MSNPILVEITRGKLIESVHRGAVAIADAEGTIRFARGDVLTPICPRSALKPLQALPLIETGAADAFALTDTEIALACSSHTGEAMHVAAVAAWLKRIDCGVDDLACGPQVPRDEPTWLEMAKRGERPSRLHNNCSGKHAGFLTLARHIKAGIAGYEHIEHPVQEAVEATLKRLTGMTELPWLVDGCAAVNFCLPLANFARALAKMAGGLTPGAARIVAAMIAHPDAVAGTGQACTELMRACGGKAAVKLGAEGVYAAIIPELGLGVALKIDDGAGRAAETAIATLLTGLKVADGRAADYVRAPILNTRGTKVGERRSTPALTQADLAEI
jgi:L-asparaginase II